MTERPCLPQSWYSVPQFNSKTRPQILSSTARNNPLHLICSYTFLALFVLLRLKGSAFISITPNFYLKCHIALNIYLNLLASKFPSKALRKMVEKAPLSEAYLTAYNGDVLIAVTVFFLPLIYLAVGLRFYCHHLNKVKWGVDDYLVLVSLFLQTGAATINFCKRQHASLLNFGVNIYYLIIQ